MSRPAVRSAVQHSHAPAARRQVEASLPAVYAALAGAREFLMTLELREVIAVLLARGWSGRRIAEHVGCCQRTVDRHRAALRNTSRG